jgi:hypothetical protein
MIPTDITTGISEPATFTEQQVLDALNAAAEDVLDAVAAGEHGLRDGLNLMVNAAVAYLRGDANDLHDVAEVSYGQTLETILGWIGEAAR